MFMVNFATTVAAYVTTLTKPAGTMMTPGQNVLMRHRHLKG